MIQIDEIITTALKNNDQPTLRIARLLKAEIMKYKTAKNSKPYDDVVEIQLITKMCKQREDSILQYKQGNREDLVEKELEELNWLSQLLPESVSESEIKNYIESEFETITKKNMGIIIKALKDKFPTTDGKILSDLVKSYLV